jgi:hypothetical protein
MKTRLGFVSNSSSSSFTCQICLGVCVSGHDGDYWDGDGFPVRAECGHEFFSDYLLNPEEVEINEEGITYVSADHCPICAMEEFPYQMLYDYMVKKHYENDNTKLEDEIRKEFGTYEKFKKYMEVEK